MLPGRNTRGVRNRVAPPALRIERDARARGGSIALGRRWLRRRTHSSPLDGTWGAFTSNRRGKRIRTLRYGPRPRGYRRCAQLLRARTTPLLTLDRHEAIRVGPPVVICVLRRSRRLFGEWRWFRGCVD